jgi:integrase/recombinase XerD
MKMTQASKEFVDGYFSTHNLSAKTKAAYCSDLAQFREFVGEDYPLVSLGATDVENWAAKLREKEYSAASMRRKIVTLRVFCSYWVRRGTLTESPFWRIRLSFGRIEQLPRALTVGEMSALLERARNTWLSVQRSDQHMEPTDRCNKQFSFSHYSSLRNLALIDLLFATGMRVGEVSALDVPDFLVEEAVFRVHGKGGRYRLACVVDQETVQIQRDYLAARRRFDTSSTALFLNISGERLSTQGIANIIARFRKEAGIERHVTPHMLRHTVATLLLRNGADIRIVQEFLGHTSIATTQRYTHITKEHLIGVLRNHHPSLTIRAKL